MTKANFQHGRSTVEFQLKVKEGQKGPAAVNVTLR